MDMTNAEVQGQMTRMVNEIKAHKAVVAKLSKELQTTQKSLVDSTKKMGNEISTLKRQMEEYRRKQVHMSQSQTEVSSQLQRIISKLR